MLHGRFNRALILTLNFSLFAAACAAANDDVENPADGDAAAPNPVTMEDGAVPEVQGNDGSIPIEEMTDAGVKTSDASAHDASPSKTNDAGADAAPVGSLIFVGDFETGDLKQWDYVEQCAAGRISVYSAATAAGRPTPREGKYAVSMHVLNTDVAPCTSTENPRAQLQSKLDLLKPGQEVWEAWSMYLPTNFPTSGCNVKPGCNPYFLFQEDYAPPWDGGSPQIGWDVLSLSGTDTFTMARGPQYGLDRPAHAAKVTGKWVDFLVHKKLANTVSGGGFVEAWIDKVPITFSGGATRLNMQTMHTTQSALGFFLASYRAVNMWDAADVYFDGARVGTTRAIVELP